MFPTFGDKDRPDSNSTPSNVSKKTSINCILGTGSIACIFNGNGSISFLKRSYIFYLVPESIDYKGHHFDPADGETLPVVEDLQIDRHEGKTCREPPADNPPL